MDPTIPPAQEPFRSISTDEHPPDQLYNREIADALVGVKLDVIGFDACLMSMMETAYAIRQNADVMVGSEELEPGAGWNYYDWLNRLWAAPDPTAIDGSALATMLVRSYEHVYGDNNPTTLSAVDLSRVPGAADAIDTFADALKARLETSATEIQQARSDVNNYAPDYRYSDDRRPLFNHIDAAYFADRVAARTSDAKLRQAASTASTAITSTILANYASKLRKGRYGSSGLAIYFPATGSQYARDLIAEGGYEKANTKYPVGFVTERRWADFLYAYNKRVR